MKNNVINIFKVYNKHNNGKLNNIVKYKYVFYTPYGYIVYLFLLSTDLVRFTILRRNNNNH